jgi:DNA helicase-2/ATP-dependent DNA helicase PcrA
MLNSEQKTAAHAEEPMVYVKADAGTGKTRMLIERMRWLIKEKGESPYSIMCCTFTRMAAGEIKSRMAVISDVRHYGIQIGTIHSIALGYIRRSTPYPHTLLSPKEEEKLFLLAASANHEYRRGRWHTPKKTLQAVLNNYYERGDEPGRLEDGYLFFKWMMAYCRDNRIMTYGMILPKFQAYLRNPDHGFVCRHILIDECQDIDTLQWRVFNTIRETTGADIFAVGDPKQGIYRWRGSLPDYPEVNRDRFTFYSLHRNHRSAQAIVDAANMLVNGKMESYRSYRGDIRHKSGMDSAKTAAYVRDILSDNGFPYSYIAILARKHVFLRKIRQELENCGIPCVYRGNGREIFADHGFIRMHNLMKLIVNPYDDFAFEQVRELLGVDTVSMAVLQQMARRVGDSVFNVWRKSERAKDNRYAEELSIYADMPCHEQYTATITYVLQEIGDIPQEILAIAYGWVVKEKESTLDRFLNWLGEYTEDEMRVKYENAVTLSTIHAAKGLEWPVVIVSAVNEDILPSKQAVSSGDLSEEYNLMYVAATRAEDMLCICSRPEITDNGRYIIQNPVSRFVKEMGL